MNQSLAQYISTWLAPSEYQLELKNRLENLCALSGTPMSPGLHQWVTDKFGLEMTRVIEDYSTFTSPKLSPELLSVVDRIVPTNYQGDDVNLSFRQLFDVGCAPPKPICYFYAEYISQYQSNENTFDNFTINGNPFNSEIGLITGNASNTINPGPSIAVFDSRFPWILTDDINSVPAPPIALDGFGNQQITSWSQGSCNLRCFELFVPQTDLLFGFLYPGIALINLIDSYFFLPSPIGLNISSASQISKIDTLYKSMFGSQASVTSTLDPNGDYIINILNTYEAFPPFWDNQTLGTMTFYEVDC